MDKSKTQLQIKIKLDIPENFEEYTEFIEQWENEGGSAVSIEKIVPSLYLPFKPGDVIKITSGHVSHEKGEFYYTATIEK